MAHCSSLLPTFPSTHVGKRRAGMAGLSWRPAVREPRAISEALESNQVSDTQVGCQVPPLT